MPARALVVGAAAPLGRLASQQWLVEGADQSPDPIGVDRLIYRGTEFGRARQSFRIPGDVLAGNPRADLAPVMDEHVLVMTERDVAMGGERRIGCAAAACEPIGHLTRKPRPPAAFPADHQAVGARLAQRLIGALQAHDIAVGDDRDPYRILDETDELPVGGAGIELAARAAMDSDHPNAA